MEPAQQLARRAGANMAIDLDVFDMVNSDMVSEGGNREFNGKGVMIAVEAVSYTHLDVYKRQE